MIDSRSNCGWWATWAGDMKTGLACLLCLTFLTFVSNINAGAVDPDLAAKLRSATKQEVISVEIAVTGGISAAELNTYLDSTCETLADRRREGVLLLQKRAKDTQADLLVSLGEMKSAGIVKSIRSHWLTNTVSVDLINTSVEAVASRFDVTAIFQYPEIIPIVPDIRRSSGRSAATSGGVEDNLKYIGADSAWRMGYTGEGRIVCHFDFTGVEGNHPALIKNWKGRDGNPTAAWIGEFNEDGYPVARELDWVHGTHVVGTMVGHDDETGDTIGVAPGADWIGAVGPVWEWAANPDRNPYTTDDVPDVINISFITGSTCLDQYWDMIDMVEALGTVVIIAAGNAGSSPYSVYGPGNRAVDSLTNFAVGSIAHSSGLLWWSSGRGPSICDSISIKPNVTAPGASIRSSVPGGLYKILGGTSMAAPHVSGAVAILRQYAPNATVIEIKQALLAGCTPRGNPSPNNHYGWGVINIPTSIEYLASNFAADIRMVSFDYAQVDVKDTVRAELAFKNRGYSVDSVYVTFAEDQPGVRILTDSIDFGNMNLSQASGGDIPFRAIFNDTMYAGAIIAIEYTIHGSNGYLRHSTFSVLAGIEVEPSFFTHSNSRLEFKVSNNGQYSNFLTDTTTYNWLYEGALMIGTDYTHVSDGFRNMSLESDDDFWFDARSSLRITTPGIIADQETSCVFDDGSAENRIGIQVTQSSYSWNEPPNDKYILMEYVIKNVSREFIDGISVGLALDWTFRRPNYDSGCEGDFSRAENLGFLFAHGPEADSLLFRGAAVLNDEGVSSYKVMVQHIDGYVHGPGLSDSAKYAALAGGFVDSNIIAGSHETLMHVIATGPFGLSPGESDTAYFAILGAESLSEMKSIAGQARERVLSLIEEYALPDYFTLSQNYPNPFNSTTSIELSLPGPSHVQLEIFNILGQRVATLANHYMAAGRYSVTWAGTDDRGKSVASGIYLYRIITADYSETKKMILLK